MAKQTHCDVILQHMKRYGSITAKEAADEYGCMRLAARISDLRTQGVAIESEIVTGKNRNGATIHFAVYRLADVDE